MQFDDITRQSRDQLRILLFRNSRTFKEFIFFIFTDANSFDFCWPIILDDTSRVLKVCLHHCTFQYDTLIGCDLLCFCLQWTD